jgi:hypothetical protein
VWATAIIAGATASVAGIVLVIAFIIAIVAGLIGGIIAAIGAADEPRTIYEAFNYADDWTNWGLGFWLIYSSNPSIYNENLAKSTYL